MARHAIITSFDHAQLPGVTVSGGAWKTNLPATNIFKIQPQLVAMADSTSVSFTINLGGTKPIDMVHLQRLVTGVSGTIRVRFGTFDSGSVNSWATDSFGIYPSLLYAALGRPRVFISPTQQSASQVLIDVTAGSGNIQIGYVGVCQALEMPQDMLIGNILTPTDESDVQIIPQGSTYITLRGKRRKLDFGMPPLREDNQDFYNFFDLVVVNGKSSPVVVSKFPDDTFNLERNTIWGSLSTDAQFANAFYAHSNSTYQITQAI